MVWVRFSGLVLVWFVWSLLRVGVGWVKRVQFGLSAGLGGVRDWCWGALGWV